MWSREDSQISRRLSFSKLSKLSKLNNLGVISASSLAIILLGFFVLPLLSASEPTHAATPVEPTISIVPASGIHLDMTPAAGTAGSFGTATASVSISSTNVTGYTFTMSTETTDTDLKNSRVDYTTHPDLKITNLTASTTESNFSPNKWGYNVNKNGTYIKGASGTYVPVPNSGSSTADKQIEVTSAPSSATYSFTYGVKANNNLPAGDYKNTIVFSAIGNEVPNVNLYDEVASMSKGTQTSADLQSAITTSNSGVYQYNTTVFGTPSDASTSSNIYYYRGILDNTQGSYGSDGDAGAYPNYVVLSSANSKQGLTTTDTCWRIVRTTGSGGIKMIYNGTWTGSTCARSTTSAQLSSTSTFNGTASTASIARQVVRMGYTHNSTYASTSTTSSVSVGTVWGTNSSFAVNNTNSTIKGAVESWYNSNLSGYGGLFESNANYCNDRNSFTTSTGSTATTSIRPYTTSTSTGSSYVAYFGAYQRNTSTKSTPPSLTCTKSSADRYSTSTSSGGNGQLSAPVALLTADEASFAGSGSATATQGSASNTKSFLNTGSNFWTMSPSYRTSGYTYTLYVNTSGQLTNNGRVDTAYGVRPVVSLKSGTEAVNGEGKSTDPWIVNPPPPVKNGMYMQDITPAHVANTPTDVTYTVKDKRDETNYTVAKLQDGNLWMTQNLELGSTSGATALTNELSNVSSSGYSLTLSSNQDAYKGNSNHYGNYYTFAQATAGSGSTTSGVDAQYDICPKNWRLPSASTSATTSEFYTMLNNYISTGTWSSTYWTGVTTTNFTNAPVSLVFSGFWDSGSLYSQGSNGRWWSSTSDGSSYAFRFYANSDGYVPPRVSGSQPDGYSVRCLVPSS